jgi:hypothetical protein
MLRTSPSIYMVFTNLEAENDCGRIGPQLGRLLASAAPSDIYTVQPFANTAVTTRIGPPQLLDVDDFMDCASTNPSNFASIELLSALNTHPVQGSYYRCNPEILLPTGMLSGVVE